MSSVRKTQQCTNFGADVKLDVQVNDSLCAGGWGSLVCVCVEGRVFVGFHLNKGDSSVACVGKV